MADVVESTSVRLHVAAAAGQDVGKGVARMTSDAFARLGVRPGDVVEVEGRRRTYVIAIPPFPTDEGLDLIRLDGLERANAGVGIRDTVEVRAADVKPAKRVVLAPAQRDVRLIGNGEALGRTLLNRPLIAGDVVSTSVWRTGTGGIDDGMPEELFRQLRSRAYGLQEIKLVVVSTKPTGGVRIMRDTEVELRPEYEEPEEIRPVDVTYDDVGGLGNTIDQVREMIELPLKHPELFHRLGIDPPKGVLLHGPPGTGKTLLARAVAHESDAAFFLVNGPEIVGKMVGESEERLRGVFREASDNAPAIIFIDEIDSIAPKRADVTNEAERRLVAQLLASMDGLQPRNNVVVIGATNRVEALDEALRRPGRFDRELIVGAPDHRGRREILEIHTRGMPLAEGVDIHELARLTYGFVGADLSALCREAALAALRRKLPEIDLEASEIAPEILEDLFVGPADFSDAVRRVQPSALREITIQMPDVGWSQIGGLDHVKRALSEGVELPLKHPDTFRRLGIRPAKGFLLYGPPGTGKTLLAKAVAREAEANFIAARAADLLSKWYGESEKQIARLFSRARQVAPTVIFIDEIDSLAPRRGSLVGEPAVTERVVNTLLAELDGLEELQSVVVLAATNQPDAVDPALLRPGRFDELIYVPVPGFDGRLHILGIHTKKMPLAPDVDLAGIARRTEGYSGADLEDLTRRAGLLALRQDPGVTSIRGEHFEQALRESRASVTPEMDEQYRKMAESLKRESPRRFGRMGFQIADEEEERPQERPPDLTPLPGPSRPEPTG